MKYMVLVVALILVLGEDTLTAQMRRAASPSRSNAGATNRSAKRSGATSARNMPSTKGKSGKTMPASNSNTAAVNVAGTWLSPEWGEMRLTQVGNTIRGTYNHERGQVEGTIQGNQVRMRWWEPANPQRDDYDMTIHPERGTAVFNATPDKGTLKGTWRYERTLPEPPDGEWTLRRLASSGAPSVETGKATNKTAVGKGAQQSNSRSGAARGAAGKGGSSVSRSFAANRTAARR
jgi:hypothetical protein